MKRFLRPLWIPLLVALVFVLLHTVPEAVGSWSGAEERFSVGALIRDTVDPLVFLVAAGAVLIFSRRSGTRADLSFLLG